MQRSFTTCKYHAPCTLSSTYNHRSTLLLSKAQDQTLNQTRLETYLSSSQPSLDISAHLSQSLNGNRPHMNGTSTPKDLNSRIKIIELFTLHVLPANAEWDYARSFVSNSDVLDEERREAFLQTLSELQEAKEQEDLTNDEALEDYGEDDSFSTPPENGHINGHRGHQRTSSEVDYGIEKDHPNGTQPTIPPPSISDTPKPPMTTLPPKPETTASPPARGTHLSPPSQTPRKPQRRQAKAQQQNTLLAQAKHLFTALSNLTRNLAGSMTSNPTAIFRMFLFLIAFLLAFSRREVRERLKQIFGKSWDKVRRTVGMGVKVSYI
jgi:hypothetical protein